MNFIEVKLYFTKDKISKKNTLFIVCFLIKNRLYFKSQKNTIFSKTDCKKKKTFYILKKTPFI